MSFLKPNNIKDLLIHIGAVIGLALVVVLFVFYVWLPISTNHGDTISVPDIVGIEESQLPEFLEDRNLRYEVTEDSSYSPDYPPLSVLTQVPPPNAKVKENRKIYVTLNSKNPPLVKMPKVEHLSLKSVQMVLKSYDFKLGKIRYVPDQFFGVVHEAKINGRTVLEGEKIEKGTVIDLVVGDGYGNTVFQSPNLVGLELEEAKFVIIGSGLKVGNIQYSATKPNDEDISPDGVLSQYPQPKSVLRIGDPVDLWVYKPDSISHQSNILDN